MNIKKRKLTLILGSLGLVASISAAIVATSLYSSNITTNNNLVTNNNINEQVNEQSTPKIATPGDYLLNDQNAIELENNISSPNTYGITNGPRGFVSVINNFITYTGFDGKVIATSTVSIIDGTNDLLSIEYNVDSKIFICLLSYQNVFLQVVSIKEADFNVTKTQNIIVRQDYPPDLSHVILTQVTSGSYLVVIKSQHIDSVINPGPTVPIYYIGCNQNSADFYIKTELIPMQKDEFVVAAGAFLTHDDLIVINLLIYNSNDRNFYMNFYRDNINTTSPISLLQREKTATNNTNLDADYILNNNLNTIYSYKSGSDQTNEWHDIFVILNWNDSATVMNKWSFHYNFPEWPGNPTIYWGMQTVVNFNVSNSYKYEIYFGRVFGDYLYAYVDYKNYIDNASKKIMRLNLKNVNNNNQLVWNNDYNNQYICLWDVPYQEANNQKPIAFPIGDPANSNIFTFSSGSNTNSYWLLDGTKPTFAYSTIASTQNITNIFTIQGVSDTVVKDANPELKTYFTKDLLQQGFNQFQKDTTYSVIKKPNLEAENVKGNIPATLTIDKGYNNSRTGYQPIDITFDIVLTGFDSETTTRIEQSDVLINSPKYPYQTGNINNNNDVKQYIYDNVIKGTYKNNLSPNDITNIQLNSHPYYNKDGILRIDSITLNRHYDRDGNLINNSPRVFTLKNNAVLEIRGFKKVSGPTSLKTQAIPVDGQLATLTTTQISLPSNKNILLQWLNAKKDSLVTNLPDESTITDFSIASITSSNGYINITFTIDGYYDNDSPLYTYTPQNRIFDNITLVNFKAEDLSTNIQKPLKPVEGSLTQIYPSDVNANNLAFKQYLFDNVVVDPPKLLTVDDVVRFAGSGDNLSGTYTLTSITLNRVTDPNGNVVIIPRTFDGFNYEIGGFLSTSLATTINPNPTQALPQSLQDILAEKITISNTDFKEYIFKYVLIDKTAQLQSTVIDSILEPAYNNLEGTIKFKLRINNSVDENGHLTNASKTFDEVITINGFKKVLPTSIVNNPVIDAGNNTILPSDADPATYTQIIKDNYATVLTNLPDSFSGTNITSVTRKSTNDELGILYVDIAIDLYYNAMDGLETHSPVLELNNIAIHGWKFYPFLILNNRVDASLYQSDFATQFAGNAIPNSVNLSILLSDQKFLDLVCPDQQGVPNNHFRADDSIIIDNLTGEIQFRVVAVGGQFHPNGDLVTLYGFRKTETIGNWINKTSHIKGNATAAIDIENDVKDQVFKATTNVLSPFGNVVVRDDIVVSLKSSSSVAVKIVNTTNFIDDSGNIVSSPTDISFNVNYQVIIENSNDNYWVYILIFSITGVVGFFLLLWLAYVIIKKCRDKWYK